MAFKKGQKKTPGSGRKRGSRNKATVDVKALAQKLLADRTYFTNFKKRLRLGTLPPTVEAMLWYYAFGKPVETVQIGAGEGGPQSFEITVIDKRKVKS